MSRPNVLKHRFGQRARGSELIRVHLTTFNHTSPPFPIVDQIRFLKRVFRHLHIEFAWGPGFSQSALNLFIENAKDAELAVVDRFNLATGKRLGVILTEHVQHKDGQLYFNTIPSKGNFTDDYLGAGESFTRLRYVLGSLDYTRKFYTLGDYPSVQFLEDLKISRAAVPIAFPPVLPKSADRRARTHDLVFTGHVTAFRAGLMKTLGSRFSLATLPVRANERERARLYRDGAFILNIPQNARWKWSSPMRILAGLSYGRTTVSIRTQAGSEIDAFVRHFDEDQAIDGIAALLENDPSAIEAKTIAAYNAAMSPASRWTAFGQDLADWAVEEGLG